MTGRDCGLRVAQSERAAAIDGSSRRCVDGLLVRAIPLLMFGLLAVGQSGCLVKAAWKAGGVLRRVRVDYNSYRAAAVTLSSYDHLPSRTNDVRHFRWLHGEDPVLPYPGEEVARPLGRAESWVLQCRAAERAGSTPRRAVIELTPRRPQDVQAPQPPAVPNDPMPDSGRPEMPLPRHAMATDRSSAKPALFGHSVGRRAIREPAPAPSGADARVPDSCVPDSCVPDPADDAAPDCGCL